MKKSIVTSLGLMAGAVLAVGVAGSMAYAISPASTIDCIAPKVTISTTEYEVNAHITAKSTCGGGGVEAMAACGNYFNPGNDVHNAGQTSSAGCDFEPLFKGSGYRWWDSNHWVNDY
jgi:hypothetical protein